VLHTDLFVASLADLKQRSVWAQTTIAATAKGKKVREHFDKATAEWFKSRPFSQTTVMQCDKCKLYYKPCLGHKCNKAKENINERKR
jgi:hypothetical protein